MAKDAPSPTPPYYDSLERTLQQAWRMLVQGAVDRRSPIHTPSVATIGVDGRPKARVVVLRHTDPIRRVLRFHTDGRSRKIAELFANPAAQIVAYDHIGKIQLRITGAATAHQDDLGSIAAWRASQPQSQLCYRQRMAPGAACDDPYSATHPDDHDGAANFATVTVDIEEIEWLYLAHTGHRRARFSWRNGYFEAGWLAP